MKIIAEREDKIVIQCECGRQWIHRAGLARVHCVACQTFEYLESLRLAQMRDRLADMVEANS